MQNYFSYISKYLSQLQGLNRLFQDWGYQPTIIPMLDAHSPYEHLSDAHLSQNFRVIDSNRELLLIRADSTLFLSRIIGTHVNKNILPLRVCYSNSVIRPTKEYNRNELWQSGIELVGISNISGDFEILLMMHRALDAITSSRYSIHVGSLSIVNQILVYMYPDMLPVQLQIVLHALSQRDKQQLFTLISKEISQVLLSIMEVEEFLQARDHISSFLPPGSHVLAEYSLLIEALAQVVNIDCIRCDLSEIGNHDYYTNIVFTGYAHGQAAPSAQGGRYDGLMQHFGVQVPAVGATVFPHTLIPYLLQDTSLSSEYGREVNTKSPFNALSDIAYPTIQDLVACAKQQKDEQL